MAKKETTPIDETPEAEAPETTPIDETSVVTIVSINVSFAPVGEEHEVSGNVANAIISKGWATLK